MTNTILGTLGLTFLLGAAALSAGCDVLDRTVGDPEPSAEPRPAEDDAAAAQLVLQGEQDPHRVVVTYPASAATTAAFGIVAWRVTSEVDGPDFEVIGFKANGRAGYHVMVWTSSNGRWLNYQNMAPHGVFAALRVTGEPELVVQPTYAENPGKWDLETAYQDAADADREAYQAGQVVAQMNHASCGGKAFEFAGTAFVTALGSLAAPEACGATAGIGCEAAFSAAAWGWAQTAQAYSAYLGCLGF